MLVSRKNLPLIHFVTAEVPPCFDMVQSPHERFDFFGIPSLGRELKQPLAEDIIQRLSL